MTKDNKNLARKIIEQHGNVTEARTHKAAPEVDDKGNITNEPKVKFYSVDLPILGMGLGGSGKTKADAVADMVKQLAGELDSGTLSLSDTWAEDNLGA